MCGIVGYLSPEKELTDTRPLVEATRLVRHRGPDDEGYALLRTAEGGCHILSGSESESRIRDLYPDISKAPSLAHNIGMGFRRFSIIELTSLGHQPFWNRDRTVCLTFNGEIYNYLELRADLEADGCIFETRSDTEVLLASYLTRGSECLKHLNGPFALAIYDTREKSLILARDRIGKSPLYYAVVNGTLYWASEIKSILRLAGAGSFTLNPQAIYDFINHGWRDLDYGTFWSGIYSLPSAAYISLDATRAIDNQSVEINLSKYWQIPSHRQTSTDISFAEACDRFREIFVDSVSIRLRADARLALALSGGLDSSAIVAVAAGILQKSVSTYTVKFKEEYADEEPYARQIRDMYRDRIDYQTWMPGDNDFWGHADAFVWLQEEPFHSPNLQTAQANYIRASQDGFRVLVTGAAGDETLAGYTEYTLPFLKYLSRHRHYLSMLTFPMSDSEGLSLYFRSLLRRLSRVTGRFWGDAGHYNPFGETLLDEVRQREGPPREFTQLMIGNMGQWKMNYWLRSGNKTVFGIPMEPRSPFLDYRLIEFLFSLPPEYVMYKGWRKYILRRSMRDILPEGIVWRRKKMGFPFNNKEWLMNSKHIALGHLNAVRDNPYLKVDGIIPQYARLTDADPLMLWRCISFALWWRRVIKGETISPETTSGAGI